MKNFIFLDSSFGPIYNVIVKALSFLLPFFISAVSSVSGKTSVCQLPTENSYTKGRAVSYEQ